MPLAQLDIEAAIRAVAARREWKPAEASAKPCIVPHNGATCPPSPYVHLSPSSTQLHGNSPSCAGEREAIQSVGLKRL